jgi:DNA-binding NarL/FixJ family response regulator
VSVCRELKQQLPHTAFLMLASYADDEALFEAVMAGATATRQLLTRLRTAQAEPAPDPLRELTEQERRVLELIGQGMTNREIGAELFLAEKTVKNYVSSLLAKLGMQRRTQAAVLATEIRERDQHHKA